MVEDSDLWRTAADFLLPFLQQEEEVEVEGHLLLLVEGEGHHPSLEEGVEGFPSPEAGAENFPSLAEGEGLLPLVAWDYECSVGQMAREGHFWLVMWPVEERVSPREMVGV